VISLIISEGDYNQAITFYTQAVDLNPNVAAYYGNRSFAYLRTECFGYALQDATAALKIDPKYIKVSNCCMHNLLTYFFYHYNIIVLVKMYWTLYSSFVTFIGVSY